MSTAGEPFRSAQGSSAAGTSPVQMPLFVESGTKGSKPYFQFIIWPVESPPDKPKGEPRVKSRWLRKQMNRKGFGAKKR